MILPWLGPKTEEHFGLSESNVVYDQPPQHFRASKLPERHALFKKLMRTAPEFSNAALAHKAALCLPSGAAGGGDGVSAMSLVGTPATASASGGIDDATGNSSVTDATNAAVIGSGEATPFTMRSADGIYSIRKDRPALLVSSTSWTPDEDFSILLDALARFDSRSTSGAAPALPFVVVVITGKGPEKARYVERMRASRMSRVALCTAWLEPEDYPLLLGSADLGVSLHTSTSGVDLPMKVVDMFGCGVPVCAMHFECLGELVQQGYNGMVFKNSTELALQLEALLDGFPRSGCELEGFRGNVRRVRRWKQSWDENAWPLIADLLSKPPSGSNGGWRWRTSTVGRRCRPTRMQVLVLAILATAVGGLVLGWVTIGWPSIPRTDGVAAVEGARGPTAGAAREVAEAPTHAAGETAATAGAAPTEVQDEWKLWL